MIATWVVVDLGAANVRAVVGNAEATERETAGGKTPDGPTDETIAEAVAGVVQAACADVSVVPPGFE